MVKMVSHESPISLLEDSLTWNDYDYCLVHLFETRPEYFAFFKKQVEEGRDVILDNSIFELRTAFEPSRFGYWIDKLNPTEYIIPDVLEDANGTIDSVYNWIKNHNRPGVKIGVVQGKTMDEMLLCYQTLDKLVDKIAFTIDYTELYDNEFGLGNLPVDWKNMVGRQMLLSALIEGGIINYSKPHHLLGCSLPQEFLMYKRETYDFIESIDTSSPIVHAIKGISYNNSGLYRKEKILLADLIDTKKEDIDGSILLLNVQTFEGIANG